jgi:hypothetical protein
MQLATIPEDIFETPMPKESSDLNERVLKQKRVKFIDIGQEYPESGGTYRHYLGCRAPEKGVIEPRIAYQNDEMKLFTVNILLPYVTPDLFKSTYSWKAKVRFLENWLYYYHREADRRLRYVYLKPERYTPMCQELRKLFTLFLENIGITRMVSETENLAANSSKTLVTMVQYDEQYRYPLQDFFSSTTQEALLKRPVRELFRISNLCESRDKNPLRSKKIFGPWRLIAVAILFLPKVRKAWKNALAQVDFSRLQFDDDDFYFCLTRFDYDYGGLTEEARRQIWMDIHNGQVPPMMEFY